MSCGECSLGETTFISCSFGGLTSDTEITTASAFIDLME